MTLSKRIHSEYNLARQAYANAGVDTEAALGRLGKTPRTRFWRDAKIDRRDAGPTQGWSRPPACCGVRLARRGPGPSGATVEVWMLEAFLKFGF